MKITVRNVYLTEFAKMSYFQRLFYLLASDVEYDRPNHNPLDWRIRDVLTVLILFSAGLFAWFILPLSLWEAHKLKTWYIDSDAATYIPRQRIIE